MEQITADADLTYQLEESEPLSRLVIEAVADAEGVAPTDLTPLYSAVDPEALDSLFKTQQQSPRDPTAGEIRFSYHGYEVRVTAAGEVELTDE